MACSHRILPSAACGVRLRCVEMVRIFMRQMVRTLREATRSQGPQSVGTSSVAVATTDSDVAPINPPFQNQDIGPRLVLPVTGGAPVFGIPLGGDLFQPVTGAVPVIGIPTSP